MRSHLPTRDHSLRTLCVALLLALAAVAALSHTASANAATKCGEQVLADWYDNGRIDKLYPLHCYDEAIDAIPNDIGPYVDAEDVIFRALQGALNGNVVKGGCDPSADGSGDDCTSSGGGKPTGQDPGQKPGDDPTTPGNSGSDPPQAQDETPTVNTSSPSSVPIPLLVLGGMSILLLAAGGLGYLSRRRHAAHADDFGDPGDPQA